MRATLLMLVCLVGATAAEDQPAQRWRGVDEVVVEQHAIAAGRPPQEPLINTDQGDLLLFLFLTAGAIGGFIAGWTARSLFGQRVQGKSCSPS